MRTAAAMPTLFLLAVAAAQDGFTALDLGRIRELYHLTDAIGERLWPGFDARRIPIAINLHDQQELLLGHPKPPAEFAAHGDVGGVAAFLRQGCTRYGPQNGGWAIELGGEHTAYVGRKRDGSATEEWLSLLLHECFHVQQKRFQAERPQGPWQEPPEDDPFYNARIGLESRVLHAALTAVDAGEVRRLGAAFVAVRHARRQGCSDGLVRCETAQEYSEGTATYVQARLYQVLDQELFLVPASRSDADYHAFADAAQRYRDLLQRVLPPPGMPITFFHAQYQNGMAQCLLLDRVRKGWKDELRAAGSSQFQLLEAEFAAVAAGEAEALAAAERAFDYGGLLREQQQVVAARVALIRGFLERPGRRYRVFHGELRGRFQWKPQGPVYRVPASLLADHTDATVWAGGIRVFEKPGLVFRSQAVPVVFRRDYLEWIDPEPEDGDLSIESAGEADGVHRRLVLKTDGFVLEATRARIVRGDGLVEVHPLPGDG